MKKKEFIIFVIVFTLSISIGIILRGSSFFSNEKIYSSSNISDFKGGDYIQLVYIGSSGCGYCNDSLHAEFVDLSDRLKAYSLNNGKKFYTTGISTDINPNKGMDFLEKAGTFDEIITGGGWYNMGVNYYIWDKFQLEGYVPQILIIDLQLDVNGSIDGILDITRKDSLLEIFSSLSELKKFRDLEIDY